MVRVRIGEAAFALAFDLASADELEKVLLEALGVAWDAVDCL